VPKFELVSNFQPQGDQQQAIDALLKGIQGGEKYQTLLGVTGSGKTFTIANVIAQLNVPTLVMSPNKPLAAQLYSEFQGFFPNNAVEYFISYYDYYQPEAYIPQSDTYIEKQTEINSEIDKLRLRATMSLIERDDVIIVASVSSIYGLGAPADYIAQLVIIKLGEEISRRDLLLKLVDIQYNRNDLDYARGTFRVRGDSVEIHPAYDDYGVRIELAYDTVQRISKINLLTGEVITELDRAAIYPAKHFITNPERILGAIKEIRAEMTNEVGRMRGEGLLLEAQRLEQRTRFDLEMLTELGTCSGVENYSRYLAGREPGSPPYTLLDYFPKKFLTVVDESHVGIPQLRGMIGGDRSRKQMLIQYGFRLPSALDNRPLTLEEWEEKVDKVVMVSATPADWELEHSGGVIVEQIIRPTGLMEPAIIVKPSKGQIDDLIEEIRVTVERGERVLVTTLTKRMSEDLAEYLSNAGIRARYMHSEIHSLERVEILTDLRKAEFDVLIGINLLREGLDLREVSLVAILDVDKEGFLRSARALMQISGRAARNVEGRVIFYADRMTDSMKSVIEETDRRRKVQAEFNRANNITPTTIQKKIENILPESNPQAGAKFSDDAIGRAAEILTPFDRERLIEYLTKEMAAAARELQFEVAAQIRDQIQSLRKGGDGGFVSEKKKTRYR